MGKNGLGYGPTGDRDRELPLFSFKKKGRRVKSGRKAIYGKAPNNVYYLLL